MDWNRLWTNVVEAVGSTLPNVLAALAIFVVGWILALIIRAGVRKTLRVAGVNQRLEAGTEQRMDLERGIATGVFYVVMMFVLIGVLNALNLQPVSEPLQSLADQVLSFLPNLIAGGVLALVAWIIATVARALSTRALAATTLDDRLSREAGVAPLSQNMGQALFWIVLLVFLPAILGTLGIGGLLGPVQGMTDRLLGMVPNVLAAVAIGAVGWFLARLLRDLVRTLVQATGVDALGDRAGLTGTVSLSQLAGLFVYIFVFVPALIAALDALKIEAISGPATDMLGQLMAAVPNIFAAGIILTVAYLVSRFVAGLVANLLEAMRFNELPARLGMSNALPEGFRLSDLARRLIVLFAMLFATVEAASRLGFASMSQTVAMFIEFGGQVLLGLLIISVGVWLSNVAHATVVQMRGPSAPFLAGLTRFGILGLVLAMGLKAMGLADEIVTLAFGLTLGAMAVAFALSFGLGGREAAGRQMEHWLSQLRRADGADVSSGGAGGTHT